ncbi:hypothetical protein LX32DRAFT_43681 [Colletotrichum zoysiae]|uniref:Uncharacterized protein n=1 Tax=Colletotrichum zoysiae TaxID=1216348 RepID=A0AAD9HRV4_9PEZI|nr:hypothetical protein LX32DRAFT_43681 [Colletotrichum zoysiae]
MCVGVSAFVREQVCRCACTCIEAEPHEGSSTGVYRSPVVVLLNVSDQQNHHQSSVSLSCNCRIYRLPSQYTKTATNLIASLVFHKNNTDQDSQLSLPEVKMLSTTYASLFDRDCVLVRTPHDEEQHDLNSEHQGTTPQDDSFCSIYVFSHISLHPSAPPTPPPRPRPGPLGPRPDVPTPPPSP